jgi:hypothetical protein
LAGCRLPGPSVGTPQRDRLRNTPYIAIVRSLTYRQDRTEQLCRYMYPLLCISPRKPSSRAPTKGDTLAQILLHAKGRQCHRYTNSQDTTPFLISICHFQSRTAEVCLACPTTPCPTKTSYHSLQEPQGALRINTRLPPYLGSEDCCYCLACMLQAVCFSFGYGDLVIC